MQQIGVCGATHNVLSALDDVPDDYQHMSGVAAALQLQYHNLNWSFVAIQEGRRPPMGKSAFTTSCILPVVRLVVLGVT